jgi:hydrogenase nickel incorporation protein HypA/HybF
MHELSIARNVVEIADDIVREARAKRCTVVRVRVGVLSGVAPEALAFCYEAATRGTRLEGSRLVVDSAPLVLRCPMCTRETEVPDVQLACPTCGTATADLTGGRELTVESVEVV